MSRSKREIFDELLDEIRRSQMATARFDQAVADAAGLNLTDMGCLDWLDREGPLTAGQLAERTGLSSGAMTTALDRLEVAGVVVRRRDAQDRRRVLVEPTPKAWEIGRFYVQHAAESERLYRQYSGDQMEFLLQFVRHSREFNERRAMEVEADRRQLRASDA
jgi:DNA-binding MarR family transcriptional regulator